MIPQIFVKNQKFAYTTGALGTRQQLIPYYYNDSNWRDKLTNYNGTAITYDGIGNVVNDGTWYYMWRGGRQLTSAQHGSQVVRYYYNHDGLRVRKTVDNVPTDYTLNGAQITHLKKGSGNDSDWMHFWYDGQGRPAIVNYNGTIYHYVYNLQGDVIALLDDSNSIVVEYKYDAWGKLLGKTGSLASTLGTLNPFRYRGYVYDEETGLYYLRSRYYNPEWGRFISADALLGKTGALLSHNLFAYCRNNPVIRRDENGQADNDSPLSLFEYIIVHEAVVFRVSMKVGGGYVHRLMTAIPNAGRHGGFGFADVIDREGNVWEIKHKSERNIVLGDVQLEAYCNWGGLTRGYDITIESFTIQLPGREILVKVDGANRVSGLVLYSIESLNNSHEYSLAPEAQARTSTSSNKQEGSSIGFALLGFAAACGVGMSIETISSRPRICLSIW